MIIAALVLLGIGGAGFLAKLVIGPNLSDRVVSLDAILTIVVTALTAWGAYTGRSTYLVVGVVVALVAFLGTSTFARFIEGRRR
ncbi:cation:proton antiporter [soil metagenome]